MNEEQRAAGAELGAAIHELLPDDAEFVLLVCIPSVDDHSVACVSSLASKGAVLQLVSVWLLEANNQVGRTSPPG